MRIVSQNKEVDINYDNKDLYIVEYKSRFYICIGFSEDDTSMGQYLTQERALQVMEEIRDQNVNLDIWKIRARNLQDEDLTYVGSEHLIKIFEFSIYNMPKE